MKPLYEYTNEYKKVIDELCLCEELGIDQLNLIDSVTDNFIEKAKNVGAYIKNMESEQSTIIEHINKMNERASNITKKIESLKTYLKFNMDQCKISEVKSPLFDIKIRSNPCKVKIIDESKIEDIYLKEKVTKILDKELIKSHLKEGINLEWAVLEKETRIEIE